MSLRAALAAITLTAASLAAPEGSAAPAGFSGKRVLISRARRV